MVLNRQVIALLVAAIVMSAAVSFAMAQIVNPGQASGAKVRPAGKDTRYLKNIDKNIVILGRAVLNIERRLGTTEFSSGTVMGLLGDIKQISRSNCLANGGSSCF